MLALTPLWCYYSLMEKRKPHYNLKEIKLVFSEESRLAITGSALKDASKLGYCKGDIINIIQNIDAQDFYKSMTSDSSPKTWQDVYHYNDEGYILYIKFISDVVTEFKLLSFKEK